MRVRTLAAVLGTALSLPAQLSGVYVVGPGASYPDLAAAIGALAAAGVAGPVTFYVLANDSGPWTIPAFPGQGAACPVSFEALGGPIVLAGAQPVLTLDGCAHVTFRGFTGQFAERLSKLASIGVREASDGDVVASGVALIAPGGRHMEVVRASGKLLVRLSFAPPVRGHRPSADVLLQSVAKNVGSRALGIVLTGMGEDGALGLSAIHEAGGHTLAQDEASSVVYGMPRAAIERGAVDKILSLSEMGAYLNALEARHHPQGGSTWNA